MMAQQAEDRARRVDGYLPINDYALLGDGRSCALVGLDGAVDWWALPTMADAPTFGAVLDPDRGGRLVLRPDVEFEARRTYLEDGGVLATVFRTGSGTVRVTDALNLGAGNTLPWCELARRVDVLDGEVPMRWEVTPGDRFAGAAPWPRFFGASPLISVDGQQLALVLDNAGEPQLLDGGFAGTFTARVGTPALLGVISSTHRPTPVPDPAEVLHRLENTAQHWSYWRGLIKYQGPWRDAVLRSALVHKQLTLWVTGGLQAAATTSLPETIGAGRNFDYRFSWVRDTGFALDALAELELRPELQDVMSYLVRAAARTAPDIRVFYTLEGEPAPAAMESVPLWRGYRDSAPVHRGNSAAKQRQLGAYGDLLECIGRYADHGNVLDAATAQLVAQTADQVCRQWREADAGLWELGEQRQYTSSKIGCWAALDRAIRLAEQGHLPAGQVDRWQEAAEQIRRYVNEACWSPAKNSYTFYAGTDKLDCAALLAARTGFCPGDDPRLHSTIDAICAELAAGKGLLYRYSGMQDEEGAFIACSFWLVEALALAGRLDEAREVMDSAVSCANDVGLLSEEIDPDDRQLRGNLPQALSHLALITAATTFHARAEHG